MRKSASVLYKQPGHFTVIARSTMIRPDIMAKVQTDGSFKNQPYILSRTAVILRTNDKIQYSLMNTYLTHKNSTESEWRSVLDGVKLSIKKEEPSIELENDNLGVMSSLIKRRKPNGHLADYYNYIFDMVKNMEWVAIRWIPRELNKSDRLFRL